MSRIEEEEPRNRRWPSSAWVSTIARSSAVSGPGFSRIASGIATLPDVVQGGGVAESLAQLVLEADPLGEQRREAPDPFDVRAGVLVAELDRHREASHGLRLRDLELRQRAAQLVGAVVDLASAARARRPSPTRQPSRPAAAASTAT